MERDLDTFRRIYTGFFSRTHYREHDTEEQEIAGEMREHLGLTEDNIVVMNPVEAIGATKDFRALVERASSIPIEEIVEQAERHKQDSFVTKSFFYFALSRFLQGEENMEQIVEEAKKYFNLLGNYTIVKLHHPKKGKHPTIFLDWHDTMLVNGGLKPNLTEFLDYCKKNGYSLIITSATYNLVGQLKQFGELTDIVDAAYEVPVILPPKKGSHIDISRTGKLYTDICKKLEIDTTSAVILTDTALDRSVENSYPIWTLATPPDTDSRVWITLLGYMQQIGNGEVARAADIIKTSPVYIHGNGMREYDVGIDSRRLTLYRHPSIYNCIFVEKVPPAILKLGGILPLDKN